MNALCLVYRSPWYVLSALTAFCAVTALYLWASQVLILDRRGVSILIEPGFIIAALIMAVLVGLALPMQFYAFRLAAATASQGGGTALGLVFGTASMTCCAPVILPSVLSLLGFSGTSILSFNGAVHRYWLPLATLSVILLSYSLVSVINSLNLECRIMQAQVVSHE